jgi:prevent-host-death family protein
MSESVASRDLRNDTAGVLRRVQSGERVTITQNGRPVAELVPLRRARRSWISRADLVARLQTAQADPGLRDDLDRIAGDTTDDLSPIE